MRTPWFQSWTRLPRLAWPRTMTPTAWLAWWGMNAPRPRIWLPWYQAQSLKDLLSVPRHQIQTHRGWRDPFRRLPWPPRPQT